MGLDGFEMNITVADRLSKMKIYEHDTISYIWR